ncbi:hypothetical protein LguiA_020456 [Lonicera macranthoides]
MDQADKSGVRISEINNTSINSIGLLILVIHRSVPGHVDGHYRRVRNPEKWQHQWLEAAELVIMVVNVKATFFGTMPQPPRESLFVLATRSLHMRNSFQFLRR